MLVSMMVLVSASVEIEDIVESKSTTITISIPTLLVVSNSGLTGLQVQVRFELDNPGNTLCLTSNGLPGQLIL